MSMTRLIPIALFAIGVFGAAGCSDPGPGEGSPMVERTIEQVQADYTDDWMAIPGVEGVALGLLDDTPCIRVFSSKRAEDLRNKIPSVVEGYPVIIEEAGTFRAFERQ